MDSAGADAAALPPVLFGRPGKKRKIYRQRPEAEDASSTDGAGGATRAISSQAAATPALPRSADGSSSGNKNGRPERRREAESGGDDNDNDDDDEDNEDDDGGLQTSVAELVRRRKMRRPRLGGVGFRGDGGGGHYGNNSTELSLVARPGGGGGGISRLWDMDGSDDGQDGDALPAGPIPIDQRFAPQTGLIGDLVNKHMEEYVEAEMAKRYNGDASPSNMHSPGGSGSGSGSGSRNTNRAGETSSRAAAEAGSSGASAATSNEVREQLAMKGKLHEIDLGAEVRARNIAMTERATRRLRSRNDSAGEAAVKNGDGEKEEEDDDGNDDNDNNNDNDAAGDDTENSARTGKKKKRLGRNGKPPHHRRGSDDVKRDQMVEQFLHENRMDVDVYDVAKEPVPNAEGRPTDDRIAEQFRREFMDALAQRLRRKRRPLGPPTKPKVRNEEEILRGPKLGGSRNVRAVMRDKLLQKQEEERQSIPKYEQQLQEQRRRQNRRR